MWVKDGGHPRTDVGPSDHSTSEFGKGQKHKRRLRLRVEKEVNVLLVPKKINIKIRQ